MNIIERKRAGTQYILAMDCETSAICKGSRNLATDENNKSRYAQPVSWGLAVLDGNTYEIIDTLYVEIKWDGKSIWDMGAEAIHGLSREYLEQHGKSEEEALIEIANFIYKYFGNRSIIALGHNVAFDIAFMQDMYDRHGIDIIFGGRRIDSFSLGHSLLGATSSDELFKLVGLSDRNSHNAMEDIIMTIEAINRIRNLFKLGLEALDNVH